MINFIGIGAQKSGTSWIYACLYEHPEVCAPVKEIHFFSRPRFSEGRQWYENHWRNCDKNLKLGEFSTSYAYSDVAAARIHTLYPDTQLLLVVRNPVERAYSQYRNAIKAGEITEDVTFAAYTESEVSCVEQGKYMNQIDRYLQYFSQEQLLVLVYEDIARDPQAFMSSIYRHIGVDDSFVPPSLQSRINIARAPKNYRIDKGMHRLAEWLRAHGLDALVHKVKRSGLPDYIRSKNTNHASPTEKAKPDTSFVASVFIDDVRQLGEYLGRDMLTEWKL